jgi:hypothetical protein
MSIAEQDRPKFLECGGLTPLLASLNDFAVLYQLNIKSGVKPPHSKSFFSSSLRSSFHAEVQI